MTNPKKLRRPNPKKEDDLTQKTKTTKPSVRIKSLKARIQTMSFPTYINFQVNNIGEGRSNMVVHSHAVILMLLSLFPESFGIFYHTSRQIFTKN